MTEPTTTLSEEMLRELREQIEFYFSDVNLLRPDKFMRERMAETREGYVQLQVLTTFKKVSAITKNISDIALSLADSGHLVLNDDKTSVRRTLPLPESWDATPRTLLAYPIPTSMDFPVIKELFSVYGSVEGVFRKTRRDPHTLESVTMAEVIFTEESTIASLMERIQTDPISIEGTLIKLMPKTEYRNVCESEDSERRKKRPEKRGREGMVASELAGCVICISTEQPLGPISNLKAMLGNDVRPLLRYIHFMEGERNKAYLVSHSAESADSIRSAYADLKIEDENIKAEIIGASEVAIYEEIARSQNERNERSESGRGRGGRGGRRGRGGRNSRRDGGRGGRGGRSDNDE